MKATSRYQAYSRSRIDERCTFSHLRFIRDVFPQQQCFFKGFNLPIGNNLFWSALIFIGIILFYPLQKGLISSYFNRVFYYISRLLIFSFNQFIALEKQSSVNKNLIIIFCDLFILLMSILRILSRRKFLKSSILYFFFFFDFSSSESSSLKFPNKRSSLLERTRFPDFLDNIFLNVLLLIVNISAGCYS